MSETQCLWRVSKGGMNFALLDIALTESMHFKHKSFGKNTVPSKQVLITLLRMGTRNNKKNPKERNSKQKNLFTTTLKNTYIINKRDSQTIKSKFTIFALSVTIFALLIASTQPSNALLIIGDTTNSTEGLGNFEAELTYDKDAATLTVQLTNTSSLNNGGYITAFAFNNPDGAITGVMLDQEPDSFDLLGKSKKDEDFQNTVSAPPFGDFDIGASTSKEWLGGENPDKGIGVGNTGTFIFILTGSAELTEQDFVDELSSGASPNYGEQFFAVRFRGFNDDGSDKVSGMTEPSPIPEPSTMILLGFGVLGLAGYGILRKKKS